MRHTAHGGDASDLPPAVLQELLDDVTAGRTLVPIHCTYRLDELAEAHADMEAGRARENSSWFLPWNELSRRRPTVDLTRDPRARPRRRRTRRHPRPTPTHSPSTAPYSRTSPASTASSPSTPTSSGLAPSASATPYTSFTHPVDHPSYVGLPATKNRGTVCGSLAHCDPLSELPAVALSLDAELVLTSADGDRIVRAEDFFVSELMTSILPGELVSAVRLRRQAPGERSAVHEITNGGHSFAVGGVVMRWAVTDGVCTMARIAPFGVGSVAQRLERSEAALVGSDLGADAVAASDRSARDAIDRTGDIHADADYRRHFVGVLRERCLREGTTSAVNEG